jgi:hypothetical protein
MTELKLDIKIEDISPAKAHLYLAAAGPNRTVRKAAVTQYASDMAAGLWRQTGQGIIFDIEGRLMDGQHRLQAIIQSNRTVKMTVVRGVSPSAMPMIDVGLKRTVGDSLGIAGVTNAAQVAAVARLALGYDMESFAKWTLRDLSSPQVNAYANEHLAGLEHAVLRAAQLRSYFPVSQSVLGAAIFIFNRIDPEACETFLTGVSNMQASYEGDPRIALIRRLQSIRNMKVIASSSQLLDVFIQCWNSWRKEEPRALVRLENSPSYREAL